MAIFPGRIARDHYSCRDNLRQIYGANPHIHLALVTTRWNLCEDKPGVGEQREEELKRMLWGDEVKDKAMVLRLHQTTESAWDVVDKVIKNFEELPSSSPIRFSGLDNLRAVNKESTGVGKRLLRWISRPFR